MTGLPNSRIVLGILALAGGVWTAAAGEPFLIQSQSPFSRLYGLPAGDDAAAVAPTGFQVRASFDLANNSFVETRGADALVLDGETWVARFGARHWWGNGWRAVMQVPIVSHQGGVADDFIEGYHDALGLPQGDRDGGP